METTVNLIHKNFCQSPLQLKGRHPSKMLFLEQADVHKNRDAI